MIKQDLRRQTFKNTVYIIVPLGVTEERFVIHQRARNPLSCFDVSDTNSITIRFPIDLINRCEFSSSGEISPQYFSLKSTCDPVIFT